MSAQALPTNVRGARSTGWWGMALFIVAELALFGSALAAYFYLRFRSPAWPPAGIEKPDLTLGWIATALLVASSLPMIWAERGIARGSAWQLRAGIAVAMAMATAFLSIQGYEYATAEFGFRTSSYGSLFFTITALHGLHVIGALLIAAYLQARSLAGHFDEDHHLAVQTGALYWHFVDIVWIAIFASLYLSVHVG
jgi:heme/copper-type cytochrome/quinol oxidase subunit 3